MSFSAVAAGFLIRRRRWFGGAAYHRYHHQHAFSLPWHRRFLYSSSGSGCNNNNNGNSDGMKGENMNNNNNNKIIKKKQQPWLLLSSPSTPETRYLYDLTLNQDDDQQGIILNREIHLPDIADEIFIGSSQGFVFSIDISPSPTLRATNPLTGAHLPLPPTSLIAPRSFDGNRISPKNLTKTWKKNREVGNVSPRFYTIHGGKVGLLSPSLDTVVFVNPKGVLSFARLGHNDDDGDNNNKWTWLVPGDWDDFIFHKGRLYTIYGHDILSLAIFDLDGSSGCDGSDQHPLALAPSQESHCPLPDGYGNDAPEMRLSLVESPDGQDLFFVLRTIGSEYDEDEDEDTNVVRLFHTNCCKVFKLEQQDDDKQLVNNKWTEVKNIGDLALFVGSKSSSISLCATDFPSLKPNSVYFSDSCTGECDFSLMPNCVGDAGVYNLEDGGIQFLQLSDGIRQLNWPRPVWYMPSSTC